MSGLALLLAAYLFGKKQLPTWILACVVIVIILSALMRLIATFALFRDTIRKLTCLKLFHRLPLFLFGEFLSSPLLFNLTLTRFHQINITLDIQNSASHQTSNGAIIRLLPA